VREDLPPTDTLAAAMRFDSGALGTLTMTFAAGSGNDDGLSVICRNGSLRVQREQLEVTRTGQTDRTLFTDQGVRDEFAAFADAIQQGVPHRNTPAQALQDVAVIEALLRSGETGAAVAPERIV